MKKGSIVLFIVLASLPLAVLNRAAESDSVNGGGILYTEPVKAVLFTHQAHGEKQGLTCERCHSGLFEMEALKVQEKKDFTMEALYRGRYCGACHNGRQAFAANTQCARCHVRIKGLEPGSKPPQGDMPAYRAAEAFGKGERAVSFGHDRHTRLVRCSVCHPGIFKLRQGANKVTFADHSAQRTCFVCHDGRKAFPSSSCNRCHAKLPAPAQPVLFGPGDKAVAFNHATHLKGSQCGDCHLKPFPFRKGSTKVTFADHAGGMACFACHREKNGRAFYQDCSRCHRDRQAAKPPASPAQPAVAPRTAVQAETPQGATQQPTAPPVAPARAAAPGGPGPLTYPGGGAAPVRFLHDRHAFSCGTCHPGLFAMKLGATPMTMAEMYQKKSCGTCHDGQTAFPATDCVKCHRND
jgi:c(7)-type cytochrome triheme protein